MVGIEAARQSILNELRAMFGGYGTYINYRHLATLIDVMTFRGHLMSITRNGM